MTNISGNSFKNHLLTNPEVARYTRQLILNEFGVTAQEKLKLSSALIVGAGGLGCPLATYLCAAGIGHLGIVDFDNVEISNLHRQIAHSSHKLGWNKAKSLAEFCEKLNDIVHIVTFEIRLNSENALDIIKQFDIVCDCTDNVPTRYLLNDACFLAGKSLVSGSALRWDGQLTVYNFRNGPCYRCLFPEPPPPETVVGCSEGGVLGVEGSLFGARFWSRMKDTDRIPLGNFLNNYLERNGVPGIIGNMQALETIKILTDLPTALDQTLILFDGLNGHFRHIKLRKKNPACKLCGPKPSILELIDYEKFCSMCASDKVQNKSVLRPAERISVEELHENRSDYILIDCRPLIEFEICHLEDSISLPLKNIEKATKDELAAEFMGSYRENQKLAVICHRGNDSQLAVVRLKQTLGDHICIVDVKGGLKEWTTKVDFNFPQY